jgi:hypothetical protein
MLLLLFFNRFNFWFILLRCFTFNFEIDRADYLILFPLRLIKLKMLFFIICALFQLAFTLSFASVHAKSRLFLQTIHSCQDKVQFCGTVKENLS